MYIWQRDSWPAITWDSASLSNLLADVARQQGRLLGRMADTGFAWRGEVDLRTLTEDIVESSAIEGERLGREQVRSSLAARLGLDVGGLVQTDRAVDGVVDMTLDATRNHARPLTPERLFRWHAALFPTGRSGINRIVAGNWRDGPMRVVSGAVGKERVHYEAPPADRVGPEMVHFLAWFESRQTVDPLLAAGLASVSVVRHDSPVRRRQRSHRSRNR